MMLYLLLVLFFSLFTEAEARLNDHTSIGEHRSIVKGKDVETGDVKLTDHAADFGIDERRLIIGGEPADITEFPFFVTIYNKKKDTFCGGTLIHSEFVLTAAHCTNKDDDEPTLVYFGAPNFNSVEQSMIKRLVRKTTLHHEYRERNQFNFYNYDIALLQIYPVQFGYKKSGRLALDIKNPPNNDTTYYLSDNNDEVIFSVKDYRYFTSESHPPFHFIFVMDASPKIDDSNGSCGTVLQCEQKFFRNLYGELKSNKRVEKVSLVKFDTSDGTIYEFENKNDPNITKRIDEESTSSSDEKPCCGCALEKVKDLFHSELENVIIFSDGWCNDKEKSDTNNNKKTKNGGDDDDVNLPSAAEIPPKSETFQVVWIGTKFGLRKTFLLHGFGITSDYIVDEIHNNSTPKHNNSTPDTQFITSDSVVDDGLIPNFTKIRIGDRLLMINGLKISGFPPEDIDQLLINSPSEITLTLTRVGESSDKQNLNDDVKNDESDYMKDLTEIGAIIHSVAIGDTNRCTSMCRVDKVTTCTEVPDPDKIPDIFSSFLSQLEFKIDKHDDVWGDSKYKTLITHNAALGRHDFLDDFRKFKSPKLTKGQFTLCVRVTSIDLQQVEDCRVFHIDFAKAKNKYPNPFLLDFVDVNDGRHIIEPGNNAIVIGLGCLDSECKNDADELRKVDLTVTSEEECKNTYYSIDKNSTICAGQDGSGDWLGDSGGPLMLFQNGSYLQVGVVSSGYENKTGIYTRTDVNQMHEWMLETTCENAVNENCIYTKNHEITRCHQKSIACGFPALANIFSSIGMSLTAIAGGLIICGTFAS